MDYQLLPVILSFSQRNLQTSSASRRKQGNIQISPHGHNYGTKSNHVTVTHLGRNGSYVIVSAFTIDKLVKYWSIMVPLSLEAPKKRIDLTLSMPLVPILTDNYGIESVKYPH